MGEERFGGEGVTPVVEMTPVKITTLEEGISTGWEKERQFTEEDAKKAVEEMDAQAIGLVTTEKVLSHEGVLVSLYLRAPDSKVGYVFKLIGNHGPGNGAKNTMIERVRYARPNSEKAVYAEAIAEYQNGAWEKK